MSGTIPPPLPLEQAQANLLAMVQPLPVEQVPADHALGRYLAAPLQAHRTQPAADLSAMDGYAVRGEEAGPWQVVGESAAGHPFAGVVNTGEAVRISTGALMPAGADAVLLQENATRDGDRLALNGEGEPTPRHIRRTGFDFTADETILAPGTHIGPAQLALALAAGNATLSVRRKPELAIIDSGDELSADVAHCAPHQIPASNGAMLAALAQSQVASRIDRIGPVPDDLRALELALEQAAHADVIITSGGASVGDHDLIRPALQAWGAEISFWRVAMKPGKPLLVARRGTQLILGLPGNPVSSYVTAFFFLLPLLRALAGAQEPLPRPVPLPVSAELRPGGSRLEFLRATIANGCVNPLDEQDSSALRSLATANGLIERPAGAPSVPSGASVPVYLF